MTRFIKNIITLLALLSSTSALAQVTWTTAKTVVLSKYSCRSDAHCTIHADLAADIKSAKCVGYIPSTKLVPGKIGTCQFVKYVCPSFTPKVWTAYIPEKGLCLSTPTPECQSAATCDDGNACTTDSCEHNSCVHTGPATCTKCTTNAGCDDSNACTVDTCVAGICQNVGEKKCVACQSDTDCGSLSDLTCAPEGTSDVSFSTGVRGTCIVETGTCRSVPYTEYCPLACATDNTSCATEESIFCEEQEHNPCTVNTYNYETGECEFTPVADGKPCQDGSVCTGNDACAQGVCVGLVDQGCDDGNACTTDSCDEATGCTHVATSCDDGDACTTDSCDPAGACAHTAKVCNDNNACTTDSCDALGACAFAAVSNGTLCTDGNVCTISDACASGSCVGVAKCDDGNKCTNDSCTNLTGVCANTAKTCDDGKATTIDSCDSATGDCVFTPISACVPASASPKVTLVNKAIDPVTIKVACTGTNPSFTTTKKSLTIAGNASQVIVGATGCWFELAVAGLNWDNLTPAQRVTETSSRITGKNACDQVVTLALTSSNYDVVVSFDTPAP